MRFLDPTGKSTYGIALCARCSRKFYLSELFEDPNYPGLYVCRYDQDVLDPYRLPPRDPDNLVLPFARPDIPIVTPTVPPVTPGDAGWPFVDDYGVSSGEGAGS